jgi:hypothetical protein
MLYGKKKKKCTALWGLSFAAVALRYHYLNYVPLYIMTAAKTTAALAAPTYSFSSHCYATASAVTRGMLPNLNRYPNRGYSTDTTHTANKLDTQTGRPLLIYTGNPGLGQQRKSNSTAQTSQQAVCQQVDRRLCQHVAVLTQQPMQL